MRDDGAWPGDSSRKWSSDSTCKCATVVRKAEGSVAAAVERRFELLSAPVRMSENDYCTACKLPAERNRSCPSLS